jgi:hypothetical protein
MTKKGNRISQALQILKALGMPAEQINDRTAICILALLDLPTNKNWNQSSNPVLGIRGILDFARTKMDVNYAENTRESIRKYSVKQLVEAGILLFNPDEPGRAVNSSKNCYQVDNTALELFRQYGSSAWRAALGNYLTKRPSLAKSFAMQRELSRLEVKIKDGKKIKLSPGEHSKLIIAIIEEFAERFIPGGELVYVGDTGAKWGYFDEALLKSLGIIVSSHGKMPDVVIYFRDKNWLILVEAVASSGPVDGIRHIELSSLFKDCSAGLVFVTAFPNRGEQLRKFVSVVAWETEVWCASDPTHLIHFNGSRFLGPH